MSTLHDKLNAPFADLAAAKPRQLTREEFLALKDSELLERALADVNSITGLKNDTGRVYAFDLNRYYANGGSSSALRTDGENDPSKCYVCAAGACAAVSLGVGSEGAWNDVYDADRAVGQRLEDISRYALGYHLGDDRIHDSVQAIHTCFMKLWSYAGDQRYHLSKEELTAYLTDVIAYLKTIGR